MVYKKNVNISQKIHSNRINTLINEIHIRIGVKIEKKKITFRDEKKRKEQKKRNNNNRIN